MALCVLFNIRDFFGWLFFLGNFALIGIGLTLLVIGSYAQIVVSNYLIFLNYPYIEMIPIFMMVIGAVVLVTCIALCSTLIYFMSKYEYFLRYGDFFSDLVTLQGYVLQGVNDDWTGSTVAKVHPLPIGMHSDLCSILSLTTTCQ